MQMCTKIHRCTFSVSIVSVMMDRDVLFPVSMRTSGYIPHNGRDDMTNEILTVSTTERLREVASKALITCVKTDIPLNRGRRERAGCQT